MKPIIHSTYGLAMGNRPEALAASGGLTPAEGKLPRHPFARTVVARWWSTLRAAMAQTRRAHLGADRRTTSAEFGPRIIEATRLFIKQAHGLADDLTRVRGDRRA